MKMVNKNLDEIYDSLQELLDDVDVPRNIKERITKVKLVLEDKELGVDKALNEMDDLMESNDIPSFVRTQIWNVVSLLESQ